MKRLLQTALLLCAALSIVNAQDNKPAAKPNFSGTWKLNVEKSNFGPTPAPQSIIDVIDHKDPALHMASTRVVDGVEDKNNLSWTTDGKDSSNTMRGNEVKSKVTWDGATLLFDSTVDVQGSTITLKDKWTLSADGKTLTMARHFVTLEGEADATYVLEKQ